MVPCGCFILLTWLTALASAEEACVPSPLGPRGHPVSAAMEEFLVSSGCVAGDTAAPRPPPRMRPTWEPPSSRSVHVMSLESAPAGGEVTVDINVEAGTRGSLRPLTLVLASPAGSTWRIRTDGLTEPLECMAHATEHVHVHGVCVLVVEPSPLGSGKALLDWSLDRLGPVTSYRHVEQANHFYIRLGADLPLLGTCSPRDSFLSQNFLVSFEKRQEVSGCQRPPRPHTPPRLRPGQDIHIVEVEAPSNGPSTGLQTDVHVEVEVEPRGGQVMQEVVLLLYCQMPVNWVIHSAAGLPLLTAYTSGRVTHKQPMKVHHLPEKELMGPSRDLIGWAQRRGLSPVETHTLVTQANRISLTISAENDLANVQVDSVPLLKFQPQIGNRNPQPASGELPINFSAHAFSHLFPPKPDKDNVNDDKSLPEGGIVPWIPWQMMPPQIGDSDLGSALNRPPGLNTTHDGHGDVVLEKEVQAGVILHCLETMMIVSVWKEASILSGGTPLRMTLSDESCVAKENKTHFSLHTTYNHCNSKSSVKQGGISYSNQIQIRIQPGATHESEDKEILRTVNLNCPLPLPIPPSIPQGSRSPPDFLDQMELDFSDRSIYSFDLFADPAFKEPITDLVRMGSDVFVKISAQIPRAKIFLRTCFVSNSRKPAVGSPSLSESEGPAHIPPEADELIANFCPVTPRIELLRDTPRDGEASVRFRFPLSDRSAARLQYLHCTVSVCLSMVGLPQIQCPDAPARPCFGNIHGPNLRHVIATTTEQRDVNVLGAASYGVDTPSVLGVAFGAFLIGALLTAALWLIHRRTGSLAVTASGAATAASCSAASVPATAPAPHPSGNAARHSDPLPGSENSTTTQSLSSCADSDK